jgi:hypothetical protein
LVGNRPDSVLPAYSSSSSSPTSLPLDSIASLTDNNDLTQSSQLKDDNFIMEVIRSIPVLHNPEKDCMSNDIVKLDNTIKDVEKIKDSNNLLGNKNNMLLKSKRSFINLFNIKKSLEQQNSVVLPASSKDVLDDNILLLDDNKNKSVIRLNSNKVDRFKMLRHFKSEGNIGKLNQLNKKNYH